MHGKRNKQDADVYVSHKMFTPEQDLSSCLGKLREAPSLINPAQANQAIRQTTNIVYLLSQYTTSIQVSSDCSSFMTGISSYNSQLTLVYLLYTEKRGHTLLPYVFIIAFPTSPFMKTLDTPFGPPKLRQGNFST